MGGRGGMARRRLLKLDSSFTFLSLGLIVGILWNGVEVSGTKILLKTRPNTYFHLPFEFSFPELRNNPSFLKFSNGYLIGISNDTSGVYNFELIEDNSVVEVELVVQRENGLCYDRAQQIFSKALTLDEKLSIAKQTEREIHITGKNRGLEFIDKLERAGDPTSMITMLRYQIPCQDYSYNSQSENEIQSSIVDIRSREKRQNKNLHEHHDDHLEAASGDGEGDLDEEDYEDEEDEEDEVGEHIVPSVPTPTFELTSKTLIPEASDADNFIEPIVLTSTATEGLEIVPTPTISSAHSRGASVPPIRATPTLAYPNNDLMSSSILMFENLADGGSGDFEIPPPVRIHHYTYPTTTTPTVPPNFDDHLGPGAIDPTLTSYHEVKPPSGPILRRKFEKILIPAGTTKRFEIPKDAYMTDNNLRFELVSDNGTLISKDIDSTNWIRFLGDSTIMFSPPTDHVSEYTYNLVAIDEKTNAKTSTELLINVRQRGKSRMYNHEFELKYTKLAEGEISELIAKIANFSRGESTTGGDDDFILVKMEADANIFKIKWTNESLYEGYNLNGCPKNDLIAIFKRLANPEGVPTPEFKNFLHPAFVPVELKINLIKPSLCDVVRPSEITMSKITSQSPKDDYPPNILNPLDRIEATEGEYLILKVREDFCYDPEDETRVGIKLMDPNFIEVNDSNWLQFDEKNHEFYGLPLRKANGLESYVLTCTDSGGKTANDAIEVSILPQQKITFSAEFSLHFQSVPFTPHNLRIFMSKLSTVFNDSITNIVVKSFQENVEQNTSQVHFIWFNKTDPSTEFELTELGRVLLSEAGPPNKRVLDIFSPKFNLSYGQVVPSGKLLGSGTPHHSDIGGSGKPDHTGGTEGDDVIKNSANDLDHSDGAYLVTYIIPSVLIFVMILLATLIACLLSRKRKAVPTTSEEETKRFIKKGVPVIFQDELEDASYNSGRGGMADLGTGSRSRSPAILREERPPLPPSYNRRSPPDYRNSAANQPSYQPPPPIGRGLPSGGSRGMRPGSGSAAANYRKPPPYVPP